MLSATYSICMRASNFIRVPGHGLTHRPRRPIRAPHRSSPRDTKAPVTLSGPRPWPRQLPHPLPGTARQAALGFRRAMNCARFALVPISTTPTRPPHLGYPTRPAPRQLLPRVSGRSSRIWQRGAQGDRTRTPSKPPLRRSPTPSRGPPSSSSGHFPMVLGTGGPLWGTGGSTPLSPSNLLYLFSLPRVDRGDGVFIETLGGRERAPQVEGRGGGWGARALRRGKGSAGTPAPLGSVVISNGFAHLQAGGGPRRGVAFRGGVLSTLVEPRHGRQRTSPCYVCGP